MASSGLVSMLASKAEFGSAVLQLRCSELSLGGFFHACYFGGCLLCLLNVEVR